MSFIDKIKAASAALQDMQRLSARALGRQLDLADDELNEIVEELVDVQQVARLDGKVLVWLGAETRASGSYWALAASAWTACRVWREARGTHAIADLEALLSEWDEVINLGGPGLYRHLWWRESAGLAQLKGDVATWRAQLQKALDSAEECGATGQAEQIREEMAAGS